MDSEKENERKDPDSKNYAFKFGYIPQTIRKTFFDYAKAIGVRKHPWNKLEKLTAKLRLQKLIESNRS